MKYIKNIVVFGFVFTLLGCQAIQSSTAVLPPTETSVQAEPFKIIVPKSLEGNSGVLKGVKLVPFENADRTQSGITKFFSVKFDFNRQGTELNTYACKGKRYNNGGKYQSCQIYKSKVEIKESDDSYEISLIPYAILSKQGRNTFFMPIALPEVTVENWYAWVANQKVSFRHKITSEYSPESIKGNFDRSLMSWNTGKEFSDSALKQFKDKYVLEDNGKTSIEVGASFYPYRNGSMVELLVSGHSVERKNNSKNWSVDFRNSIAMLEKAVND